jgi:hypothetical protein
MSTESLAGIGDNRPPLARTIAAEENFAQTVTSFLEDEYRELLQTIPDLLAQARELPVEINDDAEMGTFARLIKRFRDTTARIEAFRVKEAEPYLRGKQAVDSFFFALAEKCVRRDKKAKPGAADILAARLDDYNQRKLRAEQERRRQEEEKTRREAEERRRAEEAARQEAEEKRLAADRARKAETIEQKSAIAQEAEAQATTAKIEADLAQERAEEARIATLAKPADLVRTRVEEGPTVTMGTEPYALIVDASALDKETLWPFISEDAKEKALRSWARTTGFNKQMAGAEIGRRPKSVVR